MLVYIIYMNLIVGDKLVKLIVFGRLGLNLVLVF